MKRNALRAIPSVDALLKKFDDAPLPRAALVALIRRELASIRAACEPLTHQQIVERIRASIEALCRAKIEPVINATGVLIHTNLGRSPLGAEVVKTIESVASNYNNLEYDLTGGQRGGRAAYLEQNLAVLCGAEAATVVNNGAAALVLLLRQFVTPARPKVIISRGELIQIGGGFRIPEILEAAGAELREVGTTNKTTLSDYSRAITKQSAMILKVHRSNFFMSGFVDSPATEEMAALAKKKRIPFVEDLGSGATIATESFAGLEHEPTPAETLRCGVDLVCFSGDKILGGPQAGIIAGKRKMIDQLKRNPLFRALRCDKLILAGLQGTVDLQLAMQPDPAGSDESGLPIVEMLKTSTAALRLRAQTIVSALADLPLGATIGTSQSRMGGGALPRSSLESVTVDLKPITPLDAFAARLRAETPPVIGYVSGNRFKLDLRTVFPRQDAELIATLRRAAV